MREQGVDVGLDVPAGSPGEFITDGVDRSRVWPDMWSPTLDHKIRLTAGGEHTKENVQLSHWMCNLHKGDRFLIE
ncbi:HNH endonuclease [Streptomyces griseoluteus]|uniref:HNH endonuclease n=1 Tax=Streptomyces griseoluteus TaxID=29306 RepID=UPI00369CAC88